MRARHLPDLVAALGGASGDDLLALLAGRCTGPDAVDLGRLFTPGGPVPAEFWSRSGG